MATIEVNSTPISFNEADYLNLKSLLPKLQKEFPFETYDLKNLRFNGKLVEPNSESPLLIRTIDKDDFIKVDFCPITLNSELIELKLCKLLDQILAKIIIYTDLLKVDDNDTPKFHLSKIMDAIDIFIQGSHQCIRKLDLQDELPHRDLQIHLLSTIRAIQSAQSMEDYIVLTDLLEYELKDNLTQWKILIIPAIKNNLI